MQSLLILALALAGVDSQGVTLCPGPVGSAAAFTGAVQGLVNPASYVALLEISPDGGTFWDKTCG